MMLKSLVIGFLLSSVVSVSSEIDVSVEKIPVSVNEYVELMEVVGRLDVSALVPLQELGISSPFKFLVSGQPLLMELCLNVQEQIHKMDKHNSRHGYLRGYGGLAE